MALPPSLLIYRFQRAKPIIIDPGLYMSKKADVFWVTQRRSVPTAFKLFTGVLVLYHRSFPVHSFDAVQFYLDN